MCCSIFWKAEILILVVRWELTKRIHPVEGYIPEASYAQHKSSVSDLTTLFIPRHSQDTHETECMVRNSWFFLWDEEIRTLTEALARNVVHSWISTFLLSKRSLRLQQLLPYQLHDSSNGFIFIPYTCLTAGQKITWKWRLRRKIWRLIFFKICL